MGTVQLPKDHVLPFSDNPQEGSAPGTLMAGLLMGSEAHLPEREMGFIGLEEARSELRTHASLC